jgi:hypothetical protein
MSFCNKLISQSGFAEKHSRDLTEVFKNKIVSNRTLPYIRSIAIFACSSANDGCVLHVCNNTKYIEYLKIDFGHQSEGNRVFISVPCCRLKPDRNRVLDSCTFCVYTRPEMVKTRSTKQFKPRFVSGLGAGNREPMLRPDICLYSAGPSRTALLSAKKHTTYLAF